MRGSVKILHALGLGAILLLAVPGCGGNASKGAEQAFHNYRAALASGDMEALRATVPAAKADSLALPEVQALLEMVRAMSPEHPSVTGVTITGKRATLTLEATVDGRVAEGSANLLLEKGAWKVDHESWTMEMATGTGSGEFAARLMADRSLRPKARRSWQAHEGAVTRVVFLQDGSSLATIGYDDFMLRLWDASSGLSIDSLRLEHRPSDLAALPGGGVVVSDVYGYIASYSVGFDGWGERTPLVERSQSVTRLALTADGNHLATTSYEGPLEIWNIKTGRVEHTVDDSRSLRGVAFSPRDDFLAAGGYGNTFTIWKLDSTLDLGGRHEQTIPKVGQKSDVGVVAFSPDGKVLLTGHMDSSITLWDVKGNKQIHNFYVPNASTWDAAWCPDGTLFATAQQDGCVYLWDRETATPLAKLKGHDGAARTVAFSPMEWEMFASGGEDGKLVVWN